MAKRVSTARLRIENGQLHALFLFFVGNAPQYVKISTVWITSSVSTVLTPTSIALGNFDGLHRGHRKVIEPILNRDRSGAIAPALGSSLHDSPSVSSYPADPQNPMADPPLLRGGNGGLDAPQNPLVRGKGGLDDRKHAYSSLVTFHPHPQEFFSGESRTLLTPQVEKVKYLEAMGVQQLILLPFDRELASLSPAAFVEKILIEQLQANCISVGQDFRFGHKRKGTADDLRAIAEHYGVVVHIVPLKTADGLRISSSAIRQALTQGDIVQANQLLDRPYSLIGQVIQGQQLGRTLGFPTANLQLPPDKFLPRYGVYAVRVTWDDPQNPMPLPHASCDPWGDTPSGFASCSTWGDPKTALDSPVATLGETPRPHWLPKTALDPLTKGGLEGLDDRTSENLPHLGVMNIGCRPTVAEGSQPTVEIHILDWDGDLYGKTLNVEIEQFLRPEQKFASLDELKTQIQLDCIQAKSLALKSSLK